MAVTLAPKSNKTPNNVNLQVLGSGRMRRITSQRDELNRGFGEAETRAKASALGLPYIDLYGFPVDNSHLALIPKHAAEKIRMGVFLVNNNAILLATPEPGYNGQIEVLKDFQNQGFQPKIHFCSPLSFSKLMDRYTNIYIKEEKNDEVFLSEKSVQTSSADLNSLRDLENKLSGLSTSDIVSRILEAALQNKASDIHFEPEKETYNLRLRLDGVLHTFAKLPKEVQKGIESRIKVMSKLKLNVDNIPQDGRFSFHAGDKEIDMRVSMLPSNYGYSIVMRLLGTGSVNLNLDDLGFTGKAASRILEAVEKPQGMILTTGPTGSGKTTTLYTFLSHLNNGENKIITLEDPVEYKLAGVSQTQIDTKAGYTFGGGLRSILRQDPDVVMVGEIRDKETADVAVQASLTGHQVLSTIHTNDAAGAIPRLMEMDIKGFLLADSLSAVIGQRLGRRLCSHCKYEYEPSAEEIQFINEEMSTLSPESGVQIPHSYKLYAAKGCQECNGLGYKGRVGFYEVMTMTRGLKNLLSMESLSIMQVRDAAQQEGMITMTQDAILKALQGITDIKEVKKHV